MVWHSRWLASSVRHKLLVMALLPLLVVLPLLVAAVTLWGNAAFDRLLITKVRSDLAVARGYFTQVLGDVGSGTQSVADSHALFQAISAQNPNLLQQILASARARQGLDFLNLYRADGKFLSADWLSEGLHTERVTLADNGDRQARLSMMRADELRALAPALAGRLRIPVLATQGAAPTERSVEDRALVMLATVPVFGPDGRTLALLRGGVLLNQNLEFIDHINRIVYPEGSLPFGSHGTATLFMDDVRITTNVRLFQDQRAIGTRVSQAVRDSVLRRGETWLDRAFVVNDWYVSAYEPLLDAQGQRVGMLYVGFLEQPFRLVKYSILAVLVLIFVGVMALAAAYSLRQAQSIFRPMELMNSTMRSIEEGNPAARVGPLATGDEIGALANHLDQLLDTIDDKTHALQRWAEELDHKVAERTRELAQSHASLKQAQQQLVKSEKLAAIGQLTASVAHEINNPIAVMQGNLDLMRDTLGPHAGSVGTELRLLDEQIERMRLIVTQLLQYARPTEYAGYVEALDVNRVTQDCLVLVSHLLANTQIRVRSELQAEQRIGMNRQELQQVLINLMINAIAAMPQGGELLLQTSDWVEQGQRRGVRVAVADRGCGLSEQVQAMLFRPFFTTKNDGNGLGLWISVGLVERYGGTLQAANRDDGPGAVFTLSLLSEPMAPPESTASTHDGRPGAQV